MTGTERPSPIRGKKNRRSGARCCFWVPTFGGD
ncbi:MAG: phage DNA packaging protein J [Alteromonadaceae bacterium]|nr:phage DNA packaging protein J [Alteromonadaceae bacterium]